MTNIKLGDRVKDKISGLKGIAVGISEWLYGCRRVSVQPEEGKDGKPADMFHVDEPQLEVVKAAAITRPVAEPNQPQRNHGPREDAQRRQDAR